MSQRNNDNTKRPKTQDNQLGIIKMYAFCQKIQQSASGPRESTWGYVSVFENTPKKLLQLYLIVQGRAQLEHCSHIVKVSVKATC